MTTPLSVLVLVVKQTADEILTSALEIAESVGLPVTTWRVGDPTRTQFRALARKLATADEVQTELAKAAFITGPEGTRAEGDWLSLRSLDVYNVEREEATYATPTLELDNAGGGLYEIDTRGLVVLSSITGASYTNQAPLVINPATTGIPVLLIAEEAGSEGSIGVDEIDTIVSPTLTGVTIAGNTASTAADEQSDEGLIEQCVASLGALSPNGPVDAYEYVVRNAELTGVEGVTRALGSGDTADGTVTVYAAATTAALDGPTVALLQAAVDTWAQPLCTGATVVSGTPSTIAVTLSGVPAGMQSVSEAAIDALFAAIDFGSLVARDAITSAVRVACVAAGSAPEGAILCTLPASDATLATGVFPVRGTVTLL